MSKYSVKTEESLMDRTFTEHLALMLAALILGAAALQAYQVASPSIPKSHRPRVFMFVLTLPVVLVAIILTSNPLPALISVVQVIWRSGPSG